MTTRVFLVDDDASLCETLEVGLKKRGYDSAWATSAEAAFARILAEDFDVVVTDVRMPGGDGIALCERIAANRPDMPVIVMTAFGNLDSAVGAIRAGAYDFISKPVLIDVLAIAIDRAARTRALTEEVRRLRSDTARAGFDDLVGKSAAMQKVYDLVARVAEADVSVLVTGESGTGKEVIAQALHRRSRRARGPFVAVNCTAMPESLLESELFGHSKGAFTDAREARAGLFAEARGGTLFLDEIGDMPMTLQPKILRALQERRIRPVGANAEVPVDVRIIAATNRDLEEAIESQRFREDLFFRLNVIQIALPPLRSRVGDILPLAQNFLEVFAKRAGRAVTAIAPPAAEKLVAYSWPGNVRELQNCMERAVTLARFEQIVVDDLPEKIRDYRSSHVLVAGDDPAELVPMEEVERRYVRRVLEAVGGNKTAAARILGFERKTLYRKLDRWEPWEPAKG
ncbi:MAG TPA: sigma-54 dependent transcriptional regulator [Polyangiaceae bacterium]|jgi:two-component system response regulator HydG